MTPSRTVAFHTLGCKLNFSETSTIGRMFAESGFQKVGFEDAADVYVINTCSVTENADRECRQIIRRIRRQSPDAKVAVVGCYAQLQPETIAAIPGVNLVLGTAEKFNILERLETLSPENMKPEIHATAIDEVDFYVEAYSFGDRTRTFLKVQDGCDYGCSFCTIPLARGKSRSATIEEIVLQAEKIAASGVKEVVLTGVNIGDFGHSLTRAPSQESPKEKGVRMVSWKHGREENFLDLIKALDEVDGIKRFRISSIEPNLLTKEIIEFVATSGKFAPHFHIPLQSGSNKILKLMRRRYLRDLYSEKVHQIKQAMPHCCIGVDVIVGFPGESHDDFIETYKFLNELDISYLHVFTYSERSDTVAFEMNGVVQMDERKRRSKMLRSLSLKKKRYFYEQHLGEIRPVLFESENDNGFIRGFTDNYIKVNTSFDENLVNEIVNFRLKKIDSACEVTGTSLQYPVFSLQFEESPELQTANRKP